MAARADMTLYMTEPARSSRGGVARTVPRVVARSWLDHRSVYQRTQTVIVSKTSVAVAVQRWHGMKRKTERNGTDTKRTARVHCKTGTGGPIFKNGNTLNGRSTERERVLFNDAYCM